MFNKNRLNTYFNIQRKSNLSKMSKQNKTKMKKERKKQNENKRKKENRKFEQKKSVTFVLHVQKHVLNIAQYEKNLNCYQ